MVILDSYGDGPGVIMYAIGHNLGYIGTGAGEENDPWKCNTNTRSCTIKRCKSKI